MNCSGLRMAKSLLLALLASLLLLTTGCNMIVEPESLINSRLSQDSMEQLSATTGIYWENVQPTTLKLSARSGNWDSDAIADPVVLKIGDNNYRMWYSGRGPDGKWRVGFATSSDGISWTKADSDTNPVLVPTDPLDIVDPSLPSDIDGVRVSAVIYDPVEKDKYKMWYKGIKGSSVYIFYARSANGRTGWVKYPNVSVTNPTPKNPVPISGIEITGTYNDSNFFLGDLAVIFRRIPSINGYESYPFYEMWFTKQNGDKFNIHSATSTNGTSWTTSFFKIFTPVDSTFFEDGTVSPAVILDMMNGAQTYKLWFAGKKGGDYEIGLAYNNTDGQMFELYDPIGMTSLFTKGDIEADQDLTAYPYVMRDGNMYKMWYLGINGNSQTICYRESFSY